MIILFLALVGIAFIFFGLIPGIGAFLIRGQWHTFRQKLTQASLNRLADFSILDGSENPESKGTYRFFGRLESIQGDNRIWLTNDSVSVGIDMEKTSLYVLQSFPFDPESNSGTTDDETFSDEEPEYLPWKKIYSLPSGIQIFVSGHVWEEDGKLVFRKQEKNQPLVIIFDGPRETLLKRCIWSGRQKNEYVNQFTTVSLISGSLLLLLISFLLISNKLFMLPALLALTLSTFPLVYLLPPGVLLYFLYRFFWKRSRILRSERDLLLLPLRFFRSPQGVFDKKMETVLHDGEHYVGLEWRRNEKKLDLTIPAELKFRGSSLVHRSGEENPYFIFGVQTEKQMRSSKDPMVELICIPGDPARLSGECDRKAKELGIVSAICIFSGLLINFSIVFVILIMLVTS